MGTPSNRIDLCGSEVKTGLIIPSLGTQSHRRQCDLGTALQFALLKCSVPIENNVLQFQQKCTTTTHQKQTTENRKKNSSEDMLANVSYYKSTKANSYSVCCYIIFYKLASTTQQRLLSSSWI